MFFFAYLFSQFFYKFTPKFNWAMGSLYTVMGLVMATMTLHPSLDLFQKVRSIYFATALLWGVLTMYQSFRGMLLKKPGSAVLFVGMLIFFIAGVHDMLLAIGKIQSTSLLFTGVSSFIAGMLYVASTIFANTFLENKRLVGDLKGINDNLEHIVSERTLQLRQKTNDIQTMLQNMPQGILTLVDGGVVHPEYSAYLEEIFETKDIAGRKSMDLLFSNTNLGADILSQVDAIAGACIGEDMMNFEFNSHLMVTEFEKTMPSGKVKALELSWSPIPNESDVVEKLMICVRDVTELKLLAAEAGQQRRELEMIGQVLSVNQEKFHEFIDSALAFVGENKDLIERANGKEAGVISHLFRNMHTIKGNARTYGLLQLANIVHEAEQTYDDMRKGDAVEWDSTHLLAQLQATQVAIDEYAKINEVKLGRKGPGRRGGVDKFLMVQKDHIDSLVQGFDRLDRNNPSAVNDVLRQVQSTLRQIGTEKIADTLAGVMDSLPSLARELGKESPQITIKDNGILVKNQIADLLKNVFMHLLRNSMDHGIESAEKRVAQGKTPVGHINLELSVKDGKMIFSLRDDGRGLAVGIIRRKAVESGLITEDEVISQEAVAQLIFESGFSTAEQVTEISGRGVGMDAVKGFVQREGGTIELRFTDNAPSGYTSDFRPFETVISLPEKFSVKIAF
jgi:two-component system chemotaxis sensor kinase CheA